MIPPYMKYFNLKQANKAMLSFPIKIFPDKISGRGLQSPAAVAGHPAKRRLYKSQKRIKGRVCPRLRALVMDSLCAYRRKSV